MSTKRGWISVALLGIAMTVAACGGAQKEATEAAINAAQAAINAAQGEAAKYVPDQLQAAQNALQSAKDLAAAASAKRDEWTKEWAETSTSMPKSLDEIKTKLNAYSHGAHMPAGMDKTGLADAKEQYEKIKQGWADATSSAIQGNMADAIKKATDLNAMLAKLKEMLGIKS